MITQKLLNDVFALYSSNVAAMKGTKEVWHQDGKTHITIEFPTSLPTKAVVRLYYANGQVFKQQTYENGLLHGQELIYYENGSKWSEVWWARGKKHGLKRDYNKAGGCVFEGRFKCGVKDGIHTYYYEDGQVLNKTLGGKWVRWYKDGTIEHIRGFVYHGSDVEQELTQGVDFEETYYPDGKLKGKYDIKNGKRNGRGLVYYQTGELKSEEQYKNDALMGEKKRYYQSGTLKAKERYILPFGFKQGIPMALTEYYENGQIKYSGKRNIFGAVVESVHYDEQGNITQKDI